MTLDVLISTHGDEGLMKVERMELPKVEGVAYIVSWQIDRKNADEDNQLWHRPDVRINTHNSGGLSRNRNNSIAEAQADICLIADNDLAYTAAQLREVMRVFAENPDIDIATFRYDGDDGKTYPDHSFDLRRPPRGYWICSFEIAFRREALIKSKVRFNELFGIGAPVLGAAEEEVFIHDCLHNGMNGRFFPITITRHNGPTTGTKNATSRRVMMSKGAYHAIAHPHTATLRLAVEAFRHHRRYKVSFWSAFHTFTEGVRYIKKNSKK